MADTNGGVLERLLRAIEDQSKAAGQMVEIQHQHLDRLEAVDLRTSQQTVVLEKLVSRLERMDEARDQAVGAVKSHIDATVQAVVKGTPLDRKWWIQVIWAAGALIALGTALGINLPEILKGVVHR